MVLELTQNGAVVTGNLQAFDKAGPFSGTVSGNTVTFNFSYGMGGNGCGNAVSGTATVGVDSWTGTFSGRDCAGQAVTNGAMTLSLATVPGNRTSQVPLGGTWEGAAVVPGAYGGGNWTWVLTQSAGGDIFGESFTGSVFLAGNSLKLGTGSFSGTATNIFPGPQTTMTFNVSFPGTCLMTINVPSANLQVQAGRTVLIVGNLTSTNCNGSVAPNGFNLVRVSDSTSPPSSPAVNVTGNWVGPATDSFESGTLALQLQQTGNFVTGTLSLDRSDGTRGGNVQASLSDNILTFTLNIGPNGGCPTTVSGTAQVSSSSIDGTYSGTSCQGTVSDGRLTLRRQ